jgi:hypothetical protein
MVVAYSNSQLQVYDLDKHTIDELTNTSNNRVCSIENISDNFFACGTKDGQLMFFD